ncbi:MAG: murein hydrolase activator EnvC family protein, partial [Rhabdaerophilum calidifontis]
MPGADVQIQLRSIEKDIERSNFEQRRLAFEIENVTAEAQKLRAELIAVAARVRAAEERVAEGETRVEELRRQEDALRRSLQGRERVTAEILAAMQRIGRKPPPALLVRPEDVLQAMRAAILLGAVLPDMRDEAMILVADLKTLVELRRQAAAAAEALRGARDGIASERNRLAELVAQRQDRLKMSQEELDRERMRVATLAREARSLRDLISRSENEIVGQPRAAEIARRAPAPARGTEVASRGTG